METDHGVNVIRIGDKDLLLTATAGTAVHLSPEARPDEAARSAVPGWHLRPGRPDSSARWPDRHRAALSEPRWSGTTLCGRPWVAMAGGGGGDADQPGDEAFAPTCRRCLAIMDKFFPEPVLDDRFALIVEVITDTVAEHGYAEMWHVPGDQQAALRKQVRSALKRRTGHGAQTLAHESMILFVCEPISQGHAAERARAETEAMNSILTGELPTAMPAPWRLSWDTWATG